MAAKKPKALERLPEPPSVWFTYDWLLNGHVQITMHALDAENNQWTATAIADGNRDAIEKVRAHLDAQVRACWRI